MRMKGENSDVATAQIIKDLTSPAVTLNALEDINATTDLMFYALGGTCSDSSRTVDVEFQTGGGNDNGGQSVFLAPPIFCIDNGFGVDRTWSGDVDISALSDGAVKVKISHADAAGNPSEEIVDITKDIVLPQVGLDSPSSINSNTPNNYSLSGTCSEVDSEVQVSLTHKVNTSETVSPSPLPICQSGGTWSIQVNHTSLSNGEMISIEVSQEDSVGNIFSIVEDIEKDTQDPTLTFSANNIFSSNEATYDIDGTCSEEGETVTVTFTDSATTPQTVNATAPCSSLTWAVEDVDLSALADGNIDIEASQSDSAGNTGRSTDTVVKTNITTQVALNTPSPINAGNYSSYTISGTCAPSGETVTVDVGGVSPSSTVTCTSGTWSTNLNLSSVSDSPSVSITVNYTANSQASPVQTTSVVKDVGVPSLILNTLSGTVDRITDSNYEISGTCSENGVAVNISVTDSASPVNEVTDSVLCTGGLWLKELDLTSLQAGSLSFSITHADLAENTVEQPGTVQRDNSIIITFASPANILADNETSYSLSGTCSEAGTSVDVTLTDSATPPSESLSPSPQPNCQSDFTWEMLSLDASGLADGSVEITLSHSGANGTTTVSKGCVSGGAGTESDPTIICDYTDLKNINNGLGKHYVLGTDIDASASWIEGPDVDGNTTCTPYDGNVDTPLTNSHCAGMTPLGTFTGFLDGQDYKIKDLYINANQSHVGLFSFLTGFIQNLQLRDIRVHSRWTSIALASGEFPTTGGLVGVSSHSNDKFIDNCSVVSGKVSAVNNGVGGLGGYVRSRVSNSFVKDVVVVAEGGTEDRSFAGGFVSSVGGLVISNYVIGGRVEGPVVGGFALDIGEGYIYFSYADVEVSGTSKATSFVAEIWEDGRVRNSYGLGSVSVDTEGTLGGFTMYLNSDGVSSNNFWDTVTTGVSQGTSIAGVQGLTTANMKLPCPGPGGEISPNAICGLGEGFKYSPDSLAVGDRHYPKLKKCITCSSSIGGSTFSDELVGDQELN